LGRQRAGQSTGELLAEGQVLEGELSMAAEQEGKKSDQVE
jgi:hypothetical protein